MAGLLADFCPVALANLGCFAICGAWFLFIKLFVIQEIDCNIISSHKIKLGELVENRHTVQEKKGFIVLLFIACGCKCKPFIFGDTTWRAISNRLVEWGETEYSLLDFFLESIGQTLPSPLHLWVIRYPPWSPHFWYKSSYFSFTLIQNVFFFLCVPTLGLLCCLHKLCRATDPRFC
jgi:hypothetical protein